MVTSVTQVDIEQMRDQVFFEGPERKRRLSRYWLLLLLSAVIATAGVVSDSRSLPGSRPIGSSRSESGQSAAPSGSAGLRQTLTWREAADGRELPGRSARRTRRLSHRCQEPPPARESTTRDTSSARNSKSGRHVRLLRLLVRCDAPQRQGASIRTALGMGESAL